MMIAQHSKKYSKNLKDLPKIESKYQSDKKVQTTLALKSQGPMQTTF